MSNYFEHKKLELQKLGIEIEFNKHLLEINKELKIENDLLKDLLKKYRDKYEDYETKLRQFKPNEDLLGKEIRELPQFKILCKRTQNSIFYNLTDRVTIRDLLTRSARDLRCMPRIGTLALNEIRQFLWEVGNFKLMGE